MSKIVISEMSIHIFEVSFLEFRSIVFQSLGFGVTIQIEQKVAFETTQEVIERFLDVSLITRHSNTIESPTQELGHQMWLETAPSTTHDWKW
jgi:hypothetical protein